MVSKVCTFIIHFYALEQVTRHTTHNFIALITFIFHLFFFTFYFNCCQNSPVWLFVCSIIDLHNNSIIIINVLVIFLNHFQFTRTTV